MKTKDGRHKFKWRTYKGHKVRIDEDLVSLIDKMWALGIGTRSCCQEHCSFSCAHKWTTTKYKDGTSYSRHNKTKSCYNNVWMCFETSKDAEKFYNIVAEYVHDSWKDENKSSMYNLMSCDRFVACAGKKFKYPIDSWQWSFLLENNGVEGHFGRPKWGNKRSTVEMWIEDGCKKNNFIIVPQITFPRKHIKHVEERLQLALNKKK
jgi:hypothetical protein